MQRRGAIKIGGLLGKPGYVIGRELSSCLAIAVGYRSDDYDVRCLHNLSMIARAGGQRPEARGRGAGAGARGSKSPSAAKNEPREHLNLLNPVNP